MIEELPSRALAYRFTHELVRRALYDRLTGLRRAELHLRVGEALEARRGALRPRARRPRAPLRRRRAVRRRRARRSSTTCARRARPRRRSPSTRRRRGCARRSSSGSRSPRERAEVFLELGNATPPRRQGARRARGVQRRGGHRPRAWRRGAARARRDRLRGGVLAPGHRRPGRRGAARGGGGGARRRAARRCASGCSAGSRARSTSRATTSAAAIVRDERDRDGPRSSATAPGWPPC